MKHQDTHTPGPWTALFGLKGRCHDIYAANLSRVCGTFPLIGKQAEAEAEQKANARRIVAAVNAVEGISNADLEAGFIANLREAYAYTLDALEAYAYTVDALEKAEAALARRLRDRVTP
jgi:hypothetical protein